MRPMSGVLRALAGEQKCDAVAGASEHLAGHDTSGRRRREAIAQLFTGFSSTGAQNGNTRRKVSATRIRRVADVFDRQFRVRVQVFAQTFRRGPQSRIGPCGNGQQMQRPLQRRFRCWQLQELRRLNACAFVPLAPKELMPARRRTAVLPATT